MDFNQLSRRSLLPATLTLASLGLLVSGCGEEVNGSNVADSTMEGAGTADVPMSPSTVSSAGDVQPGGSGAEGASAPGATGGSDGAGSVMPSEPEGTAGSMAATQGSSDTDDEPPSPTMSADPGADPASPDGLDQPGESDGSGSPEETSDPSDATDPADEPSDSDPDMLEDTDMDAETDMPDGVETPDEPDAPADMFEPDLDGACTESQGVNTNASGSGPYEVIVETNADAGINEGTIFRPAELGGDEVFPIFVWGEGGCSQNGLSNASAMAEIASHGYFVVADGTPNGSGSRSMNTNDVPSMGEPLLAYVDWALSENRKPCSAYYHALDASKIASNGFSCGGLMSTGTAGDPRITTWGSTSSGTFSPDQALYQSVHTPVLIIEGGPSDIAYENGLRDYENIAPSGQPIMFFSKDIGHGGDLFQGGNGDFTKINLAWLNWWLKDDLSETGKGVLVGDSCTYCTDAEWEVMSENVP